MARGAGAAMAALLVAALLVSAADACGMSTHNEVAARALHWFGDVEYSSVLRDNLNYMQPGAFFPDFGYNCGGYPPESETAHWPQFHNASVYYIVDKYGPDPLATEEGRNLVAFIFGAVAHSVGDTSWHSLGMMGGIIQAMQYVEFHGDYSGAHGRADVGGEFVLRHMAEIDYLEKEWITPVDDLVGIFATLGQDVDPNVMANCMRIGFLGAWANQLLGELAYGYASRASSLLSNEYETYFLGGLNDMAAHTAECWADITRWIENQEVERPMCPILENHWGRAESADHHEGHREEQQDNEAILAAHGFRIEDRIVPDTGRYSFKIIRDASVAESAPLPLHAEVDLDEPTRLAAAEATCITEDEFVAQHVTLTVEADDAYAQLGYSLVAGDFDDDGLMDLAMGAPGRTVDGVLQGGGVEIFSGADASSFISRGIDSVASSEASQRLVGAEANARFGHALAVVDLNADGVDDLAVSAPHRNAFEMQYDGVVYVYFGVRGAGLSSVPSIVLSVTQTGTPPGDGQTYRFVHTVFGSSLTSADIDGDGSLDLIVGAQYADVSADDQQRGLVAAFTSTSGLNGTVEALDSAAFVLRGHHDWEQFGQSVSVVRRGSQELLLIGASSHRLGSIGSGLLCVGRLYAYALPGMELVFAITGEDEMQRFGNQAIAVESAAGNGDWQLLVSAPWAKSGDGRDEWHTGAAYIIDMNELSGNLTLEDLSPSAMLVGGMRSAQLGGTRPVVDANGAVWLSEPTFGPLNDGPIERGRIVRVPAPFPTGTHIAAEVGDICVLGSGHKARFGSAMLALDMDGNGISDIAVAAVHYQDRENARLGGRVTIFFDV